MTRKYQNRAKDAPKRRGQITGHYFYKQYMLALPKRAETVARYLHLINATFTTLFSDENFLTLLKAESMTEIPIALKPAFEEGRRRVNEIG